jgi:DNA-directed RNA polymerase specialized sigma24 family protein
MNDDDCGAVHNAAAPGRSAPLDALMRRLAAGGQVGPGYERLRFRLVTYFRMRFPADAEALADTALDRLAMRLGDGTAVQNLAAYALGIARLITLETATRRYKEREAASEAQRLVELHEHPLEPDPAAPALRACLEALGAESATLILEYYAESSGAARIERRQRLAEQTGLSLNALRNRALRIRERLEACVKARVRGDESPGADTTGWKG